MSDQSLSEVGAPATSGLEWRLGSAVVAGEVPAGLLLVGAPLMMGALVDHLGLSEPEAASLVSGELLASAVVTMAIADLLGRRGRRAIAFSGLGLFIGAQLLSTIVDSYWLLMLLRIGVGMGAGLASAAAVASAAGARDPERLFGAAGVIGALIGAAIVSPLGAVISSLGTNGAFGLCAVVAMAAVPIAGWLPPPPTRSARIEDATSWRTELWRPAFAVLAALFSLALAQNAVWTYSERIGQGIGLEVESVAQVLATSEIAALAGAAVAMILGTRFGRTLPLLVTITTTVGSIAALVNATSADAYALAMIVWAFFFAFSMPYFLGVLSVFDAGGRWATLGSGLASIGAALGPGVVSSSVEALGFGALGYWMAGTGAVAALLLGPVVIGMDRGR